MGASEIRFAKERKAWMSTAGAAGPLPSAGVRGTSAAGVYAGVHGLI